MRAPEFWRRDGVIPLLLQPFSWLWRLGTWLRRRRTTPIKIKPPVICCGGVTIGGAGKTTVALDIVARLRRSGVDAHCVTRGYGGVTIDAMRVDPSRHDAATVGDEALLLAEAAPTWVARDRAAGATAAVGAGAQAIVLDDGFLNPSLVQDFPLLVIDGGTGFGNRRVIPAGPLRETVASAAMRAKAAILIGEDQHSVDAVLPMALPLLRARLEPDRRGLPLAGRKVFALAGIAFPQKFHASLTQAEAIIVGHADFADHHPFTRAELEKVLADAAALDALPVTTPKDAMRIPPDLRHRFRIIGVRLEWADPGAIDQLLAGLVQGRRA